MKRYFIDLTGMRYSFDAVRDISSPNDVKALFNCSEVHWARLFSPILYKQLSRQMAGPLHPLYSSKFQFTMLSLLYAIVKIPTRVTLKTWMRPIENYISFVAFFG